MQYWVDFAEVLTDMERIGIRVDKEKLQKSEERARSDRNKVFFALCNRLTLAQAHLIPPLIAIDGEDVFEMGVKNVSRRQIHQYGEHRSDSGDMTLSRTSSLLLLSR